MGCSRNISTVCVRDVISLLSNVTRYRSATVKKNMSDISEESVRLDVGNKKFMMHSRPDDISSYIFT
jgi:hypothetical protein